MKKIGIVGGMGPMATVELFRIIIDNTRSKSDSEHIHILIDNNTQIPNRTEAILGRGESPVSEIVKSATGLVQLGADMILIPCNTSHYYIDNIQRQISVDVINMVEETVLFLKKNGYSKVGVIATTGTIIGAVYERYLKKHGISSVYPIDTQQEDVMDFIYSGVKSNNANFDAKKFQRIITDLYNRGAQTLILGCTEIILGVRMYDILVGDYVEPMNILARVAITKAGYSLVEKGC